MIMSNDSWKDFLAKALAVPPEIVIGSDHKYGCRCDVCLKWWIGMGPEDVDENGVLLFGPFSEDEIRKEVGDEKIEAWKERFRDREEQEADEYAVSFKVSFVFDGKDEQREFYPKTLASRFQHLLGLFGIGSTCHRVMEESDYDPDDSAPLWALDDEGNLEIGLV